MKKGLSILTVCLMVLSFVPAAFSYAEAAPTYTISNFQYQDGNQYWCVPGHPAEIRPSDGYSINLEPEGDFKEALIQTAYQELPESVFFKDLETGEVIEVPFTDKINWDQNAPGAIVTVGGEYQSYEFTEIDMGNCDTYFMEEVTIDVEVSDTNGSGVKSVQYVVSDYPLVLEDLEALDVSEWQNCYEQSPGKYALTINSIGTYILYFKITDNVENVKYVNSCLFAYGGALRIENDNSFYIGPDGTTKAKVKHEDISWLKEQAGDMTAWFGLDNSHSTFETGSVFHVKWDTETSAGNQWDDLLADLDTNHCESVEDDKMYFFDTGVTDPEGREVTNSSAPVYVEIPSDWDTDDLKAVYVAPGTDESVSISITEEDIIPAEGTQFVRLNLPHFSPYVIYDSLSDEEKAPSEPTDKEPATPDPSDPSEPSDKEPAAPATSAQTPQTGDTSHLAFWFLIICAALTACVAARRKA